MAPSSQITVGGRSAQAPIHWGHGRMMRSAVEKAVKGAERELKTEYTTEYSSFNYSEICTSGELGQAPTAASRHLLLND